jgi:hypothetical protein
MRIATFQVAIIFKQDNEIIFTIGDKLKLLQSDLKANLQLLNIPQGAPPEAPRVILTSPLLSINVGLNRLDMIINVPTQIKSNKDSSFKLLREQIERVYNSIVRDNLEYDWCGIILNLEFPSTNDTKPSLKILDGLFNELVKVEKESKELATFSLQYGFKESGLYRNVTISGFDTYDIPVAGIGINQTIDLTRMPVRESGITINIDINNKPTEPRLNFFQDIDIIQKAIYNSIEKVLYESNLLGRIK